MGRLHECSQMMSVVGCVRISHEGYLDDAVGGLRQASCLSIPQDDGRAFELRGIIHLGGEDDNNEDRWKVNIINIIIIVIINKC